jgi:hypothetical protein
MISRYLKTTTFILLFLMTAQVYGWEGMPMPKLHVEGRYLKDSHGHIVNLHGFGQTYSPWFNEKGSKWNNYDVQGCLAYNQQIIDKILDAGWKMNFIRLHMDPYWSNTPGCTPEYHEAHNCFNEARFKKYLDEVFVPMAEYAMSKGLYVVMRPPGVSPDSIKVGDDYYQYLNKVWGIVAKHPNIMNNSNIMFELANEPINILGTDGTYGSGTQGHFDNLKIYFQSVVNTIRATADNILWVPGLGYQSQYAGFATNPIEGENIGYAVHVYPGWFNSGNGYEPFQRGWDAQVQPVADFAPVMVTEMDWAPERHDKSWGKDSTGTAGGDGFGANFKKITDDCGNVSWMIFTGPELLAEYGNPDATIDVIDFLNDPEACPKPVYQWFNEYANEYGLNGASADYLTLEELIVEGGENISVITQSSKGLKINARFADGHIENVSSIANITVDNSEVIQVLRGRIFALSDGTATVNVSYTDRNQNTKQLTLHVSSSTFPLTNELFNPKIWEDGTFEESTKTLKTGLWGFGGWQYDAMDLSDYKYIVVRLGSANNASADFRIFDGPSYWGSPASFSFGNNRQLVVVLDDALKNDGTYLNPEHIYIAGFWSNGSNPFVIDTVFLSNSDEYAQPIIYAENVAGERVTTLANFIAKKDEGPSLSKSFVLSGGFLTGPIKVTTPSSFEVSIDTLKGFSSGLTIEPMTGVVNETMLFVRLKSGLASNTYAGNLTLMSSGAKSKTIALSGKVVPPTAADILQMSESKVLNVSCYTLSGQHLKNVDGMRGLFIRRIVFSDGTIRAEKIYKNQ